MKRFALFAFAFLSLTNCLPAAATPTTRPATLPAKANFHVYLLMGQSNMVGADVRTLASQAAEDPRIVALDKSGNWVVARDPLHGRGGVGPGRSFAREMLKDAGPNVTIGLIPCAVGGTPLRRWVKGGDLYETAVTRAKRAAEIGTIKGAIWHQGEADSRLESSSQENADAHENKLTSMIRDLRVDLGQPDLPVVVGQLGEWLSKERYCYADTVRQAIKNAATETTHVGYADSAGLDHKGDNLHFSADAQAEFGARYAKAMRELQKQSAGPAATIDLWPTGKMPGRPATQPEAAQKPNGDGNTRISDVSRPTLSLFPAPKSDKPAPTLIVSPGGGYKYVVIDKEGNEIAAWLNRAGYTALVLKYRVPDNREGALQDIQRAISITRARAAELNIDPNRLGVMGFSAGGNLSAKASTHFNQRAYPAIDAADEQSRRPDFAVLVYPAYLDDKEGKLNPDLHFTPQLKVPPTLIIHSEDDAKYIAGSKLYDAALTDAKLPHVFKNYPTGGHGYALRGTKDAKVWPDAALEWLKSLPDAK
jgi:acetyl esterase/lipase